MHPVGPNREGHIRTVVDDEVRPPLGGQGPKLLGQSRKLPDRHVLLSKLKPPGPAVQGARHDVGERPAPGLGPVCDDHQVDLSGQLPHSMSPSRGLEAEA